MPTKKQAKSSKNPTTKSKKPSPIERELLECYKNRQHVLLYGDVSIELKKLIRKVHIAGGGIDAEVECYTHDGKPIRQEEFLNRRKKIFLDNISNIQNVIESDDYVVPDKPQVPYAQSTEKTFMDFDFERRGGKEVYIILVFRKNYIEERRHDEDEMTIDDYELEYRRNAFHILLGGSGSPKHKGVFFEFKGTLFIDNLHCDRKNREDNYCYRKLGEVIRDCGRVGDQTKFNWLVCYTKDLNSFPEEFTKQFKVIPLSPEVIQEDQPKTEKVIKLKIVRNEKKVYWEGNPLPITKDTNFNILAELAKNTRKTCKE